MYHHHHPPQSMVRSEYQDNERQQLFGSTLKVSGVNQHDHRAQSVKQWGMNADGGLSVADSNHYIEDSDEDGDFLEYEIKLKYDPDQILSLQTIVQIFDKRQMIRGIKKMKYDFKNKRRILLADGNEAQYKKIVLLYKRAIESKLEDNLKLIAKKLNLTMDQIEAAQEKHLMNKELAFVLGVKEFLKIEIPPWLTSEKAYSIYNEIKEQTQKLCEEVGILNISKMIIQNFNDDGRQVDLYADDDTTDLIKYKTLDQIFMKYQIEDEQLKHVLYVNYVLSAQMSEADSDSNYDSNRQYYK